MSDPAAEVVDELAEPWAWWVWALTLVAYIGAGYFLKSALLNWIVGPLFPLVVLYLVPRAFGRRDTELAELDP